MVDLVRTKDLNRWQLPVIWTIQKNTVFARRSHIYTEALQLQLLGHQIIVNKVNSYVSVCHTRNLYY